MKLGRQYLKNNHARCSSIKTQLRITSLHLFMPVRAALSSPITNSRFLSVSFVRCY